ncbi:CAP domain-containing protein [Corynebacterium sp. H127]|uniref:CAP domain-containing protein n=1 Tax=Corynebacterium sp. H127 TaxID=3133418 RepID=UPI00309FAB2E
MTSSFAKVLVSATIIGTSAILAPAAGAQVVGSSQLPPLPVIQLPPLNIPGLPWVAAPAPAAGNSIVDTLLAQMNGERIGRGLQPVQFDFGLADSAYVHAQGQVANHTLDHQVGDYYEILARVPNLGMAVPMWIESPSHRDIMLNGDLSRVGIAAEYDHALGKWVIVARFL